MCVFLDRRTRRHDLVLWQADILEAERVRVFGRTEARVAHRRQLGRAIELAEGYSFARMFRFNIPGHHEAVQGGGQWIIDSQHKSGGWDYSYDEASGRSRSSVVYTTPMVKGGGSKSRLQESRIRDRGLKELKHR